MDNLLPELFYNVPLSLNQWKVFLHDRVQFYAALWAHQMPMTHLNLNAIIRPAFLLLRAPK